MSDIDAEQQKKLERVTDETKRKMFAFYNEGETLEAVGKRFGVTKQWIAQLLKDGNNGGLFIYPIPSPVPRDIQALLEAYRRQPSMDKVAKYLGMTKSRLSAWIKDNGVSKGELERAASEGRRDRAFSEYQLIVEKLGSHPTTTILQRDYKSLAARISNYWGSFQAFREVHDIPAPAQGNPNLRDDVAEWVAESKRRAAERRSEILRKIIEFITPKALTFAELSDRIDAGELLLREVIVTAQDAGEIERIGPRSQSRYRILSTIGEPPDAADQPPDTMPYKYGTGAPWISLGTFIDEEARRKALERRTRAHQRLCDALAAHCQSKDMECEFSAYIDLLVDGKIMVEVKTLEEDDALKQVRAAVSQLLFYRFSYQRRYSALILIAAFSKRPRLPRGDAVAFLSSCGIESIWNHDGSLTGTARAVEVLRLAQSI